LHEKYEHYFLSQNDKSMHGLQGERPLENVLDLEQE
jgi:hypothetical protein